MKKFLSLLLAVVMIVGIVPLVAFTVGAAGGEAGAPIVSEFPNLVITELLPNSYNYNNHLLGLEKWYENIPAFRSTNRNEDYYQSIAVAPGADVQNYYKASGTFGSTNVTFTKCASGE